MSEAWSAEEVAATVTEYFAMLGCELRGEPYNKAEHNRRLRAVLNGRSAPAVEFKHANISAVLIELGLPYIAGYRPRANYQLSLMEEVQSRLERAPQLRESAANAVDAMEVDVPRVDRLEEVIVPSPSREFRRKAYERATPAASARMRVNYLGREARNASLGRAGELFALEVEFRRLRESGAKALADRVEHVAATRGDGLEYDILSFEVDGREWLIEVKTTRFGAHTPFFASGNEVSVSAERPDEYSLYRVFEFKRRPRLFIASGSLRDRFELAPTQYRASVG